MYYCVSGIVHGVLANVLAVNDAAVHLLLLAQVHGKVVFTLPPCQ
jgi:hypothetical protein